MAAKKMQIHYILSVTSNDKPGVVEAISAIVENCGGSWLESRLAHLNGKFAGVIRIRVEQQQADNLEQQLRQLEQKAIYVSAEALTEAGTTGKQKNAKFTAIGPDRVGIVKEISRALLQHNINVEELETDLTSMPYSGEPIFEARGILSLPAGFDIRELHEKMDVIANDLGLDLDVDAL